MKTTIFAIVLLSSSLALAAVQFRADSEIPAELQAQISQTLAKQCVETAQRNASVTEISTEVFVDRVDNGLTDTYFTTTFAVEDSDLMIVKSIFTEANNGQHLSVEILQGCH